MTTNLSFVCACCGRNVINPRFAGGKAYGKECFKKVEGVTLRKTRAFYVKATQVAIDTESFFPTATYTIEGINGVSFKVGAALPLHTLKAEGVELCDLLPVNALQVLKDDGKPAFKSLAVSLKDKALVYTDKLGQQTRIVF